MQLVGGIPNMGGAARQNVVPIETNQKHIRGSEYDLAKMGSHGEDVGERLALSWSALKDYFTGAVKRKGGANPGQLVLFAEHAIKVYF